LGGKEGIWFYEIIQERKENPAPLKNTHIMN